ncbi:hypothetical protein [Halospeciosus flavus]
MNHPDGEPGERVADEQRFEVAGERAEVGGEPFDPAELDALGASRRSR